VLAEKGRVEAAPAGSLVGHEAEAVDIEFSKPDLTVEPVTLTPKPKK